MTSISNNEDWYLRWILMDLLEKGSLSVEPQSKTDDFYGAIQMLNWKEFHDPDQFRSFMANKIRTLDRSSVIVYWSMGEQKFSLDRMPTAKSNPKLYPHATGAVISVSDPNSINAPPKLPARPREYNTKASLPDSSNSFVASSHDISRKSLSKSGSEEFASQPMSNKQNARPLPEPPKNIESGGCQQQQTSFTTDFTYIPMTVEDWQITSYENILFYAFALDKGFLKTVVPDASFLEDGVTTSTKLEEYLRLNYEVVTAKRHRNILASLDSLVKNSQFVPDPTRIRLNLLRIKGNEASISDTSTSDEYQKWIRRSVAVIYNTLLSELENFVYFDASMKPEGEVLDWIRNFAADYHANDIPVSAGDYLEKIYDFQQDCKQKFIESTFKYHPLNLSNIQSCFYLLKALEAMVLSWPIKDSSPEIIGKSTPKSSSSKSPWLKYTFSPKSSNNASTSTRKTDVVPEAQSQKTLPESLQNLFFSLFLCASGSNDLTCQLATCLLSFEKFLNEPPASMSVIKFSDTISSARNLSASFKSFVDSMSIPFKRSCLRPLLIERIVNPIQMNLSMLDVALTKNAPLVMDQLLVMILLAPLLSDKDFKVALPVGRSDSPSVQYLKGFLRPIIQGLNDELERKWLSDSSEWPIVCKKIHEDCIQSYENAFPYAENHLNKDVFFEIIHAPVISRFNQLVAQMLSDPNTSLTSNLMKLVVEYKVLEKQVSYYKQDFLSAYKFDMLDYHPFLEHLVNIWLEDQKNKLIPTMKRCIDADKEFHAVEPEKIFHSTSVIDTFSMIHPVLEFFLAIPIADVVERHLGMVVGTILDVIDKYVDLMISGTGRFLTEAELTPFDKYQINHEIFEATVLKKKKHLIGPLSELCSRVAKFQGKEKLMVQLVNVEFSIKQLRKIEENVRQQMKGLIGEDSIESVSEQFDGCKKRLQNHSDRFRRYLALKLNFVDMREICETLYIPCVRENPIQNLYGRVIDGTLSAIVNNLPESLVNRCIMEFFTVFMRIYEGILMEGGKERVFTREDCETLIDDIVFIESTFSISDGAHFGLESEVVKQQTKAIKIIISTVFALTTDELIREYETSLKTVNYAEPLDQTLKNPYSIYNLIRVLMHRRDKSAKAFFQKLKLKTTFSKFIG